MCTSRYYIVSGMQEDEFLDPNDISNDIDPIEQGEVVQINIEYDVCSSIFMFVP